MSSGESIDHYVRSYGDLLFDLCETVLRSPIHTQIAFRSILRKLKSGSRFQKYSSYERSWVLRVACDQLLNLFQFQGYKPSSQEQAEADAIDNLPARLKQFPAYFHRLTPEDQILLLLKDKYGIPYTEISTAMATPEGSLKIRRQQALRSLEEWLWNDN